LTANQVRKLMLARAIAGRPNLLLVDGTLDSFPDAEARRLAEMLAAPGQPWTLVLVTGRERLFDLATHRLLLPSGALHVMHGINEELELTNAR
jgi:predicted ABC-type transport system involved in lysophospholipase L1 biosynthesis ATPase subunit